MSKKLIKNQFQLLNIDRVELGARWNFKNVISPYYRVYYIESGTGSIRSMDGLTELKPGMLYMIPSYTLCDLSCEHQLGQYFVQFFEESSDGISLFGQARKVMQIAASQLDIDNFHRLLDINPGRGINRSDNPRVYEKDVYYKEYTQLNNIQGIAEQYETQGILLTLISRFLRHESFRTAKNAPIPSAILEAISYIQVNISSSLKVSFLADRANLNTDYFSRTFTKFTGKSPVSYILEKRVERAQYLIITTRALYGEIAQLTGFENSQYFSRIFRKHTGLTPKEYRRQNQNLNDFVR